MKTNEKTAGETAGAKEQVFIVSKVFCECFTVCDSVKAATELERAMKFYANNLKTYRFNLEHYPNMTDHWNEQIERIEKMLASGFEALNWDGFYRRQKEEWLSKNAMEITAEQYEYALNELPPMNWHGCKEYSTFFMSEFLTMTFTDQYYFDRQQGKYYTAVVDVCDKSTWIDRLLENNKED